MIPPAIFHTILENGMTHGLPRDGKLIFRLSYSNTNKENRFEFHMIGKIRKKRKNKKSGTGHKYIRSRLQESFPDRWSFTSEKSSGGWLTVITIQS